MTPSSGSSGPGGSAARLKGSRRGGSRAKRSMIAQPPCEAPITTMRSGSTKGIRRASASETSTSPARSEPIRTWPAQTSRQASPPRPRGPWLSTTIAAQPWAFSIDAQRSRLSCGPSQPE